MFFLPKARMTERKLFKLYMKFIAEKSDENQTVGFFLSKKKVSKRLTAKLKRTENGITKNGVHCRTVDVLKQGDIVEIKMNDQKTLEPNEELFVPIAFENNDFVVFDKPPLMPVHPSIKHQGDTLGNFFAAKYPQITFRPVNRLDRDTSGLCVAAKNSFYATALQFSIKKTYYAVVTGKISHSGSIDAPIARERESIIKRIVSPQGQTAVTHFVPIKSDREGKFTLVKIPLETGRTHQIRVHFSHIGHPLAGDGLYGEKSDLIERQALHCGKLEITLPDGEVIQVCSEIPQDMRRLVEA